MATITSTFKMRDNATKTIETVIGGVNRFIDKINQANNTTSKIKKPQDDGTKGFSKWEEKIIAINQGLQLAQSLANGVSRALEYTDSLTLTKARLDLMNDGLQTTAELQDKIAAAAKRSRGNYQDMASSIAKLGLLAGDAFSSNDEMIAFSEMMNKSFKVSGASNQEISSATYQLTQAMAAGKLQGDEFRSIMENAPMLADAIAKYTGKTKGELKEMSSEGLITADIIKNSLFSAAEEINAKYQEMPMTFGDAMTQMKNTAATAFQPVADKISKMLNSEKFTKFLGVVEKAVEGFATVVEGALNILGKIANWVYDNLDYVLLILSGITVYMIVSAVPAIMAMVDALLLKAAAWALANWQILAVIGALTIGYAIFQKTQSILTALAAVIAIVAIAYLVWNGVQWALNGAMYMCPIVWIIVLIIALIAVIYLIVEAIVQATDATHTSLGYISGAFAVAAAAIYNVIAAAVNLVIDVFVVLWNFIAAFVNFFANVFNDPVGAIARLFFDLVDTILELLEGLASVIDTIFGSDLASSVQGWRDDLGSWVDKEFGEENEVMAKIDGTAYHMGRWEYGEAWDNGLEWGDNLAESIESFDMDALKDSLLGGAEDDADKYGGYDFQSLLDANGNVPVDVKNSKEVDISDEDLKMLKDIATRDYMLNYKHITPNVNIEFGDVRETADVNKIKDALSKMMEEELAELYVVEEA